MKKHYKYLISALCLTLFSISSFAGSAPISIVMNGIGLGEEDIEYHKKGHRIPSARKECTIDFENHRIELSTSEFILSYELWDEDGTINLTDIYESTTGSLLTFWNVTGRRG